jgi:hypothetical protein
VLSFLSPNKIFIGAGLILVLGFGWYYNSSQNKIEELITAQAQLISSNKSNTATITALKNSAESNAVRSFELTQSLSARETESRELILLLAEHDLEYLSISKPGLIERRINDGTSEVFRNLESVTSR